MAITRIHTGTVLLVWAFIMVTACSSDNGNTTPIDPPDNGKVIGTAQVWVTNGLQTKLLEKQPDIDVYDISNSDFPTITVNDSQKYQEIDGFGAALTGSSAFLINKRMDNVQRNILLTQLFDKTDGLGISYLRLTIGSSDFSLEDYTYNDLEAGETDPDQELFSIAKDEENIIPVLKDIVGISPGIKLMGSPWSPPAWMKSGQSLHGGSLRPEWYASYAQYFAEYINAYSGHGLTIDAITVQNEPLHETNAYPSMRMEAGEQAAFIGEYLGPLFQDRNIGTKIVAYDHNFDHPDYPIAVLDNEKANPFVAGSAFHAYAGDVSAMGTVHSKYPDKGLYFTEISGGEWSTDFFSNLKWNMDNVFMGSLTNWSRSVLLWNLALDANNGPTNGGCQDCRGVVTITASGVPERNVEFYAIGHFSKFIRPGAYRLGSNELSDSYGLKSVAFLNADGSRVLVVLNASDKSQTFSIKWDEGKSDHTLERQALATIVYK